MVNILRSLQLADNVMDSNDLYVCPRHVSPTNDTRSRHRFNHCKYTTLNITIDQYINQSINQSINQHYSRSIHLTEQSECLDASCRPELIIKIGRQFFLDRKEIMDNSVHTLSPRAEYKKWQAVCT